MPGLLGCRLRGRLQPRPANQVGRQKLRKEALCWAQQGGDGGPVAANWRSKDPYKVLNVSEDSDAETIKAAYRNLMKEYHPDVYSGVEDANIIADRLIRAYKLLIDDDDREQIRLRKERGPFREPDGPAVSVFVNEFRCIGPQCPYSCVRKAPKTFYFAQETMRARATNRGGDDDYNIQMAVGQCPETCIHFVTEDQRLELEQLMESAVVRGERSDEVQYQMEMLIATANFENGRDRKPRRTPKKRDQYVDWF
ncbi:chaperone DnaJ-domain superfamily protein [Klebsormidium nitens]|uniref:Chaperone DnaJ-domain superfamily protein n=1 Tax=Klebsormidium nitens TaxID=105231 RepID=A0A0U9HP97_KLENI|nr:chaperone DnaJ-domain superfamily protein [Klebsormidium nitens]|eukprot:GAQ86648.1 chaperone DnaJ-domain superfamily protein [Klebsormidium nitens]